jgi:hypothetical protein
MCFRLITTSLVSRLAPLVEAAARGDAPGDEARELASPQAASSPSRPEPAVANASPAPPMLKLPERVMELALLSGRPLAYTLPARRRARPAARPALLAWACCSHASSISSCTLPCLLACRCRPGGGCLGERGLGELAPAAGGPAVGLLGALEEGEPASWRAGKGLEAVGWRGRMLLGLAAGAGPCSCCLLSLTCSCRLASVLAR